MPADLLRRHDAQVLDPTNAVELADALNALAARDGRLLMIEVGPGRALTTIARQHPALQAGRHRVRDQRVAPPIAGGREGCHIA